MQQQWILIKLNLNINDKGLELKASSVNNICGNRTISNINCQLENYGSDHFPVIIKLKI